MTALGLSTALVMVASWMVATPAFAASTLGLEKEASVDEASPGEDFKYTLTPRCSGLTEACINAVLTDVVPVGVEITALPASTPEYTVAFDAGSRTLTVTFLIPLPAPSPAGSVGLPAGSSRNIELGVKIPDNSQTPDGTVITNSGLLKADNAPDATAAAPVTVDVPRVVTPVATKAWSDGSAVAHSGEAGVITLGARNASSSTAQVSSLVVEDSTPAVFERFDVTGVGPVTFPAGADRVTVLACTVVLSACDDADYGTGTPQTGPTLALPVPADDVTGLRFVFSSSTGAVLPFDPTGGSVQVGTVLRDTLRSTGADYSPTVRDDISNCATPSAIDPVLGTVSAVQACAPYSVQPAQATTAMTKSYFSDTNGDYTADGQAVVGLSSLVSGLVRSTNTSPFPVATMTIVEPGSTPSEFSKLDLSRSRIVFPNGATQATVQIKCDDTDTRTLQFTAPPTTVDIPTPCPTGNAAGVSVTFTGTDANGVGTIAQNAVAVLGIQGRLNDQVTDSDVTDGGVSNCADGTATSTGNGIGSAAGNVCANVVVQPAFAQLNGVKTSQLPTILPGLPRQFTLSFKNNGTIPATGVVLADPADPTVSPNAFDAIRLSNLTLPASPAATAEVYDPDANAYVPYDAADAALLTRATGFRVSVAAVPAGQSYALTAQVLLRDGIEPGATIQNCASIGSDTQPPTRFCAPQITVLAQSSGAAVQKSISPATSVRPQPGLPGANIQVKYATQNSGTLWLKQLIVTDVDTAFFDAVDVRPTDPIRVNFPPSANRVRVDACTGACGDADFVTGTVSASQNPPLPIPAADVRGLRVTFLTADGSFTIKPGTNFPATGLCSGASICVNVAPRAELRSAPGTPVPTELSNTATGQYESTQQNGTPADIPETTATHTLTDGSAALRFAKGSDISVSPGTPIPVTLTATNTGTGVIPEPQIVDPIPAQLEFSPNDPATPYSVAYTLPADAPSPPEPVFTAVSDDLGKVTSIRVEWPGWDMLPGTVVTVTIQLKLAPGNTAGSVIENRAGATGNRPDLSCASGGPRPGTATDDPTYGDGTYCTSAAQVTTLAGNAFRTEKWVAGDVTLGWLNSLTGELVALEDPGCPRLDVDGQLFTRYPCVARVAPGQGFDFYLRLTNAGTNPATEVRVVDVFPAPGDTGVILTGEQRETEWQQAPTLLGPVTLAGSGVLGSSYSGANPVCTTDLNRPPTACADSDWDLGYDPAATAFRGIVTFPGQLAPGASSAMRFRMAAPPAPTDPAQNEIAWNSFAHTEFFQETGRIVQLPPTEPIKTGVALVYGGLSISKVVIGEPSADQTGPYGFQYECSVTPEVATGDPAGTAVIAASGTLDLAAGETQNIANVPARARCLVWEPDSDGLISDAASRATAKQVVIPVDGSTDVPAEVTVTNTVPPVGPSTTEPPTTEPPTTEPTVPTTTQPITTQPTVTVYPGSGGGYGSSGYPGDGKGSNLSYTGVDVAGLLTIAALLLLAGGVFVIVARRRRYRRTH